MRLFLPKPAILSLTGAKGGNITVKRLLLSAALIILAIFVGIFLAWRYSTARAAELPAEKGPATEVTSDAPKPDAPPATEGDVSPSPTDDPEETLPQTGYYLREHEGRVAVFPAGSDTPELVFDVYIRMLPEPDRALLQQGVYVADYEALTRLVEDYIS